MKTTIEIADPLLAEARQVAEREGTTLRALVERGLRQVLTPPGAGAAPFRLRQASFKGQGLQPELQEGAWERVRELAYAGRGG